MSDVDLYALLDVEPDASPEEVRAAWRRAIADLDPDDRRFRAHNQAAAVLLDPERRAAYDASRPAEADEPEHDASASGEEPAAGPDRPPEGPGGPPVRREPGRLRLDAPGLVAAALVPLTLVALGVAWYLWQSHPSAAAVEDASRQAQAAAERAIVPVLSYDYRDLAGSQQAAERQLTPAYSKEYDSFFQVIRDNAPATRTTVSAEVVSSGIVRAGDDRVQVLVFVDRPTTNKTHPKPLDYHDQVTVTMVRQGDSWRVDGLKTSPAQS